MLERYKLLEAKTCTTPSDASVKLKKPSKDKVDELNPTKSQSQVGSLICAAMATRPDIAHAVSVVSKFNSCPSTAHFTAGMVFFMIFFKHNKRNGSSPLRRFFGAVLPGRLAAEMGPATRYTLWCIPRV